MFRVHVPAEQQAIHLDVSGEADVVYTVSNTSSKRLPGRAEIRPELGAEPAWFHVAEPRHREFRGKEAQQFKIEVTIPPDTPAGVYGFCLVAVNEDDPDEDFAEGESVTLHWNPGLVKRIDRTVIALLTLVAIVGLLAISGVIYLVANREIRPPETLRAANRAAAAGKWEDYWDCWTEEGQDELLVRTAGLLETAEQRADLEVWMRGYGIRLDDVEGVSRHTMAGDASIMETAKRLKDRFENVGRTEKDFFVGAAQWLEDVREADSLEAHSRAEFRRELQYELDQAVPLDDDLAQQVAIWDGKQTSPAATDTGGAAEQTAVRIIFHKTGRHWLLHDVYPEELTRRIVWVPLPGRVPANAADTSPDEVNTRIEMTRRPVTAPGESPYQATVQIYRSKSDGPEHASLKLPPGDGDKAVSNDYTLTIGRETYSASIVRPFFILDKDKEKSQVFVESGARVTVGNFLYRQWSEVKAILELEPFHHKLLFWKDGKRNKFSDVQEPENSAAPFFISAVYRGPDPAAIVPSGEATQEVGGNDQAATKGDDTTPPPGAVMLNAGQELRLFDGRGTVEARPDSESSEFLIIELVAQDPLAKTSDPVMRNLKGDLARAIKLGAEADVRNALDRKGFDYFIDYSYKSEDRSVALNWVVNNGRKRLKVTLNRFGTEFQPNRTTGLWGANALAFRRERDGLRLAIGNNQGDVLLESNLNFDVPQNSWKWSGTQRGLASLRPELDVPLQHVSLRGGARLDGDSRPVVWSGTSTVMPFDKMDFALSDERSAAERAFGSVAISPDGQWLAGGDSRGRLRIWRLRGDGKWSLTQEARLGEFLRSISPQISLQMRSIAFSADADRIAVAVSVLFESKKNDGGSEDDKLPKSGYVLVLHRHAKALPYGVMPRLDVSGTAPLSVAFSRDEDSRYLAAGLANGKLARWTWNAANTSYKEDKEDDGADGDGSPVLSLAFGPRDEPDWLAVGQASGTVRLGTWTEENNDEPDGQIDDKEKWSEIFASRPASQDEGALRAVAFSPQGAILAGVSDSGVRLWQLKPLDIEREQ